MKTSISILLLISFFLVSGASCKKDLKDNTNIEISVDSIAPTKVFKTSTFKIRVKNTGSNELSINLFEVLKDNGELYFSANTANNYSNIQAGETRIFSINFSPKVAGTQSCIVRIVSINLTRNHETRIEATAVPRHLLCSPSVGQWSDCNPGNLVISNKVNDIVTEQTVAVGDYAFGFYSMNDTTGVAYLKYERCDGSPISDADEIKIFNRIQCNDIMASGYPVTIAGFKCLKVMIPLNLQEPLELVSNVKGKHTRPLTMFWQ
ncbi:MAG TPA: hypothetical protein VGF79_08040 [Bacteroidia bacterium]